jgi:hypothetical protein
MVTDDVRLRLEALIARSPTRKCKAIVAVLEELVAEHPGLVRLDVYLAGEQPSVQPTGGYQGFRKFKHVPSAFINGKVVAVREVPAKEAVEKVNDPSPVLEHRNRKPNDAVSIVTSKG